MHSVSNQTPETHRPSFRMSIRTALKLLAICLIVVAVPLALYVRVRSEHSGLFAKDSVAVNPVTVKKHSKGQVTVQAAGRGKPYLNLQDGRKASVEYRGDSVLAGALQNDTAQARALAAADFDRNGTQDVVAVYGFNGAGMITLQRGNPDAFAPTNDSVFARLQQGYNPDSLLPVVDVYPVPVAADFVVTGNFTNDSEKDVVLATKGGGLYLMAGDGTGRLGDPQQIALPGPVTTLAAGEFRTSDGFADLAVGVTGSGGDVLLIFDGAQGFSNALVQYQLGQPASAIEFGGLDDDPFGDVAVAAGSEVLIVHGWGRKEQVAVGSRVERVNVAAGVRGLALGEFAWDRHGRSEIAALTYDGTVHIVQHGKLDTRPFNEAEAAQRTRGRSMPKGIVSQDIESVPSWKPGQAAGWIDSKQFLGSNLSSDLPKPLMRTHLSHREMDEVMLLGQSQSQLEIVRPLGPNDPAPDQSVLMMDDATKITLDVESTPVAALALPKKLNGVSDVVVLSSTSSELNIVPNAPNTSITVDRTDDVAAASACTGAASDCSLRGALTFANNPANNNTTINIPAGTYALTINGGSATGCDGNATGDLAANQTMTLVGAGAATTIIRQQGTGPANDGDRVMCMDEPFTQNLIYNFSGLTFAGGRDGTAAGTGAAIGGGGIIGGEKGNVLTLTNVVLANNQVTVLGSGNLGGGGIQWTGGDLNIVNSTIGGSGAPGIYTDRASVTAANLQAGSGGGVTFTPSAPQHTAATGILTVSGSTFSRNTAASPSAGGGGADLLIFAFAAPGGIGTGSATIGTSTFSNNQALGTGNGGGIIVESLPTTVATTSFTNNSAANRGGGIFVAGASLLLNGATPSITFTGNTATNGGSSVSTSAAVNVAGTNTTIGGDIEINTLGTWTNNAGSSLAPTNVVVTGGTFNMNNSTMNVSGNLTIGPGPVVGSTFNGNTGTVNIQGNFVLNAGGAPATTLNAGTGTFNFNGTGAQSITNGTNITFFNLTDSNITQPLTLNNSFAVGGSLNVNGANAILAPVAAAVISGTGTLTGTGTARVTRIAATADFSSQYSITNKTLTNLTVEYIGAAQQILSPITFGPLKINNNSGVNLSGISNVNGLLTLTTGALGVGNQTLVINNGTSVGAGSITSNPIGTVNYNQGSDGQNVLAFNYGNLTFSNFNKVLASTGTIGVAGVFTPGIATGHTIAGSTINFNGAGAQTIPAFNYNNLTISGARGANNITLANGGTVGVAGIFSPTATFAGGNYVVTNNTVDFNGSAVQTIPAFNYFNLTSSNAGARTLANSGLIGIASVFTPGTNVYTITGSTVVYNGTSPQTLPPTFITYNNLTSNNTAGVTGFAGLTVQQLLRVQTGTFTSSSTYNNVQIDSGATLAGTNATTINVSGNWTNNGTFTANTNTVNFNGSAAQVIGGSSATTFNNLTVANAVSVTLGQNATVNAVLTLTNDLSTGANVLTMPNTGTSAGTADVIGNVKRTGFAGGGPALSFGNPFNSIGFIAQGTVPTDILVNLVKTSPAALPTAVQRTYTITPNGGVGFSATVRLHYLDPELNANVENGLGLFRLGAAWVRLGKSASDIVNNWVELSGVTQFSAWTLSSAKNDTTTTITSDNPDPSQVGETVVVNFTVVSNVAGAPAVTGNVTITVNDASGDTCTGTVAAGTCNLTLTTFGLKTLTATYSGDDNFNTSTDTESHTVDEPDVTVTVAPTSVLEDGPDNLVYTFTREGQTTSALTVNFTVGGTASSTDYVLTGFATFDGTTNGTVTIPIGSSTAMLTVNPTTDSTVEPDETAIVSAVAGTGYDVGVPGSATGTITNDDTDVSVAVAPTSTLEDGAGNLVYTFTRAGVTTGALTANFTIGGTATFNTDYTQTGAATFTPPTGTVLFAAGSATATVTIDPTADITVESDETVILTVAAGTGYNVAAVNSFATGTITNDDTDVSVAVAPASVNEDAAGNLVYTFTRAGVTSGALTVNFSIGGTATFNTDYTQTGAATFIPPSGTVTFGAGNSTATVTVDPSADVTSEPDETVILTVETGTGYNVVEPSSATGTIIDDDVTVSVAVSPGAVDEDGIANLVYTFTRNDSEGALTANFSIGGTAIFNNDYTQTGAATFVPPNGTVSFAAGELTATVTIDPAADNIVEPDDTVILTVVAGSGYSVGAPSSATGTITNDDTDVSVAVAPTSTLEDGAGNLVYTFTRAGVTTGELTANFTIGGTATFNTDYTQTGAATFTPPTGTVLFADGSATAMVTIDPTPDTTVESDETVILTVAAGTGYVVAPMNSSATGTITNDDTDVSVAVAPASVNEDAAGNLVYTFTRAGVTSGALTVNFSIGGTATFNTDYTQTGAATFIPPSGTVTFGAGNSTATVTVDPSADITSEPDETVILTVEAGTGYNVVEPSSATGTITNDDVTVSVAVSPGAVAEDGVTNLVYTFTRSDSAGALTVNFSVGGTAIFNNDYTQTGAATFVPPNGTVSFADGELTTTVTIDPAADNIVEPDDTVILTVVAGSGYNVGTPSSATGTITNDDTDVSVTVAPTSTLEDGAGNLVYTFTRAGVTTGELTANFTIGGTATFNTDYTQTGAATFTPPTGTVLFADGSATATVTIDPTADTTVESDETVILTVAAGTGYLVAPMNSSATGTITNDDTDVSVAVAPASVNEDAAGNLVYTFTRAGVTTSALTVNFSIGGTATFNTDYTQTGAATFIPPSGTVTFGAGNSTATVTVDPSADITSEPDETVILTLEAGTGYNVVEPSSATGTITNDDVTVSVAVSPGAVAEDGLTNLVYTFTRSDSAGALTVNFSVGGTAIFNNDYTQTGAATFVPPNGTVSFANGELTTTITVDPATDNIVEPDETVILTVVAGSGYNVGAPSSATGTITNDDTEVSVAVSPSSVNEDGATNLVYTFTRAGVTTGALTANFSVGGTASFGSSPNDYTQTGAATFTPPTGTVAFSAGSSTATVTVNPETDTTVEPDETVILTVVAGASYSVGAPSSATGTITNDDTDVSVAVAPASVAEDGATNLVYTFTRAGVTSSALTANFSIGGTATFSVDYTQAGAASFVPPNGTVIFGAGNATATVTVNPSADITSEPDETVILTVTAGTGYNVGSPSSATGTILNDDAVDVEITAKTDTPDPVCVGQNITYTIGFRNNASGAASNAKVSDTIPANTTFVSATLPMGWSRADSVVAGGTGTLMFTKASAAGGETASFTVVVKINAGTTGGTIISNTATASSDVVDNVPGNNSKTATTTVDPTPPAINGLAADPASLWPKNHKMRDVTINYTATDGCSGVNCQITNIASNEPINGTGDGDTSPDWEFVDEHHVRLRAESAGGSNGRIYTITVTCTDAAGNTTTKTVEVHVGHNIISPTSGSAFKINTAITFSGTFWDVSGKRHTAAWQFDDLTTGATITEPVASKNGTAKGTYTFKDPGIYKVTLKVTDNTGVTSWVDTQDDVDAIVVVYDPASGYTIGGGWIYSPLGALVSDPTKTGKMTFGFNSKFFKGATNPKGESQLDFLLGNLEFNALNYEYLVIDKALAQFRGFGKLNGSAGYDFIVTVIDGSLPGGGGVDKFRIKIWEKTSGIIVYDNQMGASDAAIPTMSIGPGGDISIKK
jgi:Bacterial Ig-like domain (group 3)/PKD domain/Calx-beta domain